MPPEEWEEAGKWKSAMQAFLLLAFFFAAVAFGADFRPPLEPEAARVELVNLSPPEPPAPVPEPEPVKTPEPKPVPKPEPPPQTETPADIALRKQREEEERARKKREEEKRLAEEKRREEARRLDEERQAAEARRAALGRLRDSYTGRIIGSIKPHLIEPLELTAADLENLEVVMEVRLDAGGNLADNLPPLILEPSGNAEYDEAAKRAIFKAVPLPMPKEPELLEDFRILTLRITPE